MPRLALHRLPMDHPGDLSALAALFDAGALRPEDVRAVIGKTEGNGGLNDFTRGYFTQSLMALLAARTGEAAEALAARIPCVLSGGTEGVLSPHYTVFAREAGGGARGLAIGTAFGAPVGRHEIGRGRQVASVAETVRAAMAEAGIARAEDVAFVQVKAPALGREVPGAPAPRSPDPKALMALSRAAAALGVARALGEVGEVPEAALLSDLSLFSARASVSSGVEVSCNEVVVLGLAEGWAPGLRMAVRPMADALDLPAVCAAFGDVGLRAAPSLLPEDRARVLAVLVKGEPDRSGAIRGQRHTMLGDTDLDPQRHLRGALGGLVAGVLGEGRIFVSGGAEHQGPPGGGLIAVIAREG